MQIRQARSRASRWVSVAASLFLAGGVLAGLSPTAANAATTRTFLVVYKTDAVTSASLKAITASGGRVRARYGPIGVAVVTTSSSGFRADLVRRDPSVLGASATAAFATRLSDDVGASDSSEAPAVPTPAPGADNLSGLQWDMDQISAPQAHETNGGSSSVVVGDIDTGLDYTHPDLAPNVDFSDSVSCVGGVPNQNPSAWMDDNGHGTHTAGTIAASKNTVGIVGVAPNVQIAGIKAGDANGFFYPEAVVCAFMWAGSHGIQVTNNSYFADPWLFNCVNDPDQRAIWIAERRAIGYAQSKGTLVVAAMGNFADDLAHPSQDVISPDDGTPLTREISNDCSVIPVEVPGVVGVTADGNLQLKSFYSNYGIGIADVTAPGGDSILQRTTAAPNGRVLSTYPASLIGFINPARRVFDCSVSPCATYAYLQGTSMASPHVAGVAALIASTGVTSPGAIASRLEGTADSMACPSDLSIYAFFPSQSNGAPQTCDGSVGYNSFYGHGQVNALTAAG